MVETKNMEDKRHKAEESADFPKSPFPSAEDWLGDQDVDEDVEKHRAKVSLHPPI